MLQNPHLKADLEELGLAKADLMQAGLFRNPKVDLQTKFPINPNIVKPSFVTQYDAHLVFSLSELWQIGARKKVAQDELEIVSMRNNQTILETYAHAKKAYFDCIAALARRDLADKIVEIAYAWKDRMYYRKDFGLVTDLDTYRADAQIGDYELDIIHHNQEVQTDFIKLRYLLGTDVSSAHIPLTEQFNVPETLPNLQNLITWALADHPAMQLAHLKIQQAEHRLSLEKRRTIKEVDIGFAFERDFDRPIGPGLYVGMELPFFDRNAAQIAHANAQVNKAAKELKLQEAITQKNVAEAYQAVVAAYEATKTYATIVNNYAKAVTFANEQVLSMMFDKTVALETNLSLHQAKKRQITAYNALAHTWTDLEKAVGRKIPLINADNLMSTPSMELQSDEVYAHVITMAPKRDRKQSSALKDVSKNIKLLFPNAITASNQK